MDESKKVLDKRINPRMLSSEPLKRCCLDECKGACCIFGVWVDRREVEDILANAKLIQPFMPEDLHNPGEWFVPVEDDDKNSPSGKVIHTAVEPAPWHYGETACVFCREGGKCSLQMAGTANGLHPWRFKPYYCILHPLDLDDEGRITLDTVDAVLAEEGSCLRRADSPIPLIETFTSELEYLLGEKAFTAVKKFAEDNENQKADSSAQDF